MHALGFERRVSSSDSNGHVVGGEKVSAGSFGVISRWWFRWNHVAIKKMKEVDASNGCKADFEKDVAMLDKFRCHYTIHVSGRARSPTT